MATKTKTSLKWLLDKTGGALISWLCNHPKWAVSVLTPLGAATLWAYRQWTSLAWLERLASITLVTICMGLLAVTSVRLNFAKTQ